MWIRSNSFLAKHLVASGEVLHREISSVWSVWSVGTSSNIREEAWDILGPKVKICQKRLSVQPL